MATELVTLQGKGQHCHFVALDQFGKWGLKFYPDDKSLGILRELQTGIGQIQGIKNQLKKDEDGFNMQISRKPEMWVKGKNTPLAPPLVMKADGMPLVDQLVGHGSDLTLTVECYQHRIPGAQGQGRALRLKAVRVDKLNPFTPHKDYTPAEQAAVAETMATPPQKELWN